MPFAAAASEHPLATHAVGEVVGSILEQVGDAPDLAVLFVTGPFAGAMDDVAHAVRALLHPKLLLGATAVSILAGPTELEERPAIALFAADWRGRLRIGRSGARTTRFDAERRGDGWRLGGTADIAVDGATLILLADPFTFPVDGFVDELARRQPGLTVVGGLASAATGPGGNRLVADDLVTDRGAVGVFLPPGVPVQALVSQGCRPVGQPYVVTRAHDNLVEEIGGQPALDRLLGIAEEATPSDRSLLSRSVQIGLVLDERQESYGSGDFLVRPVLGADRETRAIALGTEIEVGQTIQFQVRDADSADADLRATLAGADGRAALVFCCNGRGRSLFGEADHDASVVFEHLEGGATAGMFCAGEIGPLGGRTRVHGFSASMLLFDD